MTDRPIILAVDDATESLALLADILTPAGYEVRLADSGPLALAAALAQPPDLILLDIQMPGIDGLEVCRRLKAREETRSAPIILLSAYAEVKDWVAGLRLGAADYICKPFQSEELLNRVHTQLALSRTESLTEEAAALRRSKAELEAEILKRRQAEEKLLHLASIVQSSDDAIIGKDLEGRILSWNQAAERIYGYAAEEVVGRSLSLLVPRDRADELPSILARLKAGESVEHYVTQRIRKDGQSIYVSLTVSPIKDDSGGVLGASTIARDITSRRRAEEQVRIFSRAVEQSPSLIMITNTSGDIEYVNPRFTAVTGYTLDEVRGKNPRVLKGDATPAVEYQRLWQTITQGKEWQGEFHNRKKSGEHYWEFASISPIVDEAGRVTHFLAVKEDITERKRMETALRENFHRLDSVLNTIPDPIWFKDRDGRYQAVNLAWLQFFDLELEDVLGKTNGQLLPAEIAERLTREDVQVMATRKPLYHVEPLSGAGGGLKWFDTIKVPLEDTAGQVVGTVGVARNVTERKALEEKLRQAQKMEAIGQLAGGVAHDFNNILAVIILHLALLRENPNVDAATQESLAELTTEAQRAASLTRQLLLFSRRSVLDVKVLELNELAANLLKMLGRLIGEHIRLIFDRYEALPPVKADPGMIEQVLMNLAVNARDAMPKGGQLTISMKPIQADAQRLIGKPEVEPGRFVCLTVADTGVGMDDATLKRIFEPFFTTKEPGKGTGLGLATVYGIAAQHKGWVEVESELGKGTTFRVFFPATSTAAPESAKASEAKTVGGNETILLVEDEAGLRRVARQVLQKLGYRVLEAANGPEALRLWQEHADHIDLLFSDMVMPEGLMGSDLVEKFREKKPSLKVILSSGYNAELAGQSRSIIGGIAYLQKPYQIEVMSKMIRECLDGK